MSTAGVRDEGETEPENPPAFLKSAVWQHFAFPLSYVNNKVQFVGYATHMHTLLHTHTHSAETQAVVVNYPLPASDLLFVFNSLLK